MLCNFSLFIYNFGDATRFGSLNRRFLRRGKANCRCADPQHLGHGPYWSLTFNSGGKTMTGFIPPHAIKHIRQQIADYKRFRTALTQKRVTALESSTLIRQV